MGGTAHSRADAPQESGSGPGTDREIPGAMNNTSLMAVLLLACGAPVSTFDAGLAVVDAGLQPTDAGDVDAGTADAGLPLDAGTTLPADAGWQRLATVAFNGKQDDIHFVDATHGWYANGEGFLYRTQNGGMTWQLANERPGTYWRALGFVDENVGVLGNIGTGVFPGVTDSTPLYLTTNGGQTLTPVSSTGPAAAGICAVDVLRIGDSVVIHAAGRVRGPAHLMRSTDKGQTWVTSDLSASIAMVTDVKFLTPEVGFVVGGSSSNLGASKAVIIKTVNGGATWTKVYESSRVAELIWKLSLPSSQVGYATVQSYDSARAQQVVAKTTNGGDTWLEVPLVRDATARQLGVGFITESIGWVGTAGSGYQTVNGGLTWQPVNMGEAVNKVRTIKTARGFVAYAIGFDVFKLDAER